MDRHWAKAHCENLHIQYSRQRVKVPLKNERILQELAQSPACFLETERERWSAGLAKSGTEPLVGSELRVAEKAAAVKAKDGNQICAPPELAAIHGGRAAVSGVRLDFFPAMRFRQKGRTRNIYGEGEECGEHMQALSAGGGGDGEQGRAYHGGVL